MEKTLNAVRAGEDDPGISTVGERLDNSAHELRRSAVHELQGWQLDDLGAFFFEQLAQGAALLPCSSNEHSLPEQRPSREPIEILVQSDHVADHRNSRRSKLGSFGAVDNVAEDAVEALLAGKCAPANQRGWRRRRLAFREQS